MEFYNNFLCGKNKYTDYLPLIYRSFTTYFVKQAKFQVKYARDLKAESHKYAWLLLLSLFALFALVQIFKTASNGKSFRHQQWISLYTQVSYYRMYVWTISSDPFKIVALKRAALYNVLQHLFLLFVGRRQVVEW